MGSGVRQFVGGDLGAHRLKEGYDLRTAHRREIIEKGVNGITGFIRGFRRYATTPTVIHVTPLRG